VELPKSALGALYQPDRVRADSLQDPSSNLDIAYSAFCQLLQCSARKSILRGCGQLYIPTWDSDCDQRYNAFLLAESRVDSDFKAEELTSCLDRKRRERWIESVEGLDFTHSNRKAWNTFNYFRVLLAC